MRRRGLHTLDVFHDDAPKPIFGRREVSVASHGEDGIGTLRAHQTTHTAPRIPLDKVPFPLRERGLVGTCTNSNCLCYNSVTEHGQMLGVAIACGQFLAVFHTVHLLSISYRKLVIFGGTD